MTPEQTRSIAAQMVPNSEVGLWAEKRREIVARILDDDISKFLNWSCIVATMFVGDAPYTKTEYRALASDEQPGRWRYAFQEEWIGNPPPLPWFKETSGNLIHQAYHLWQWEKITGKRVSDLAQIVEIGGGYGAMARIARRLGFAGEYLIVDFPEVQLLQKYYLGQIGIDDIDFVSCIPKSATADLMIATWSLSEMESDQRDAVLSGIQSDHILIAYADCVWDGVSNGDYFEKVAGERIKIDHMAPWANVYIIR